MVLQIEKTNMEAKDMSDKVEQFNNWLNNVTLQYACHHTSSFSKKLEVKPNGSLIVSKRNNVTDKDWTVVKETMQSFIALETYYDLHE